MKLSDKWIVTSYDSDQVTLRRETDETLEESTIQRPDNTKPSAWLTMWPVGAAYGNAEFHDLMRFESVRRKDVGVGLNKSEQAAVARWNRP
jgi:hypothetical protein